MADEQTSLQESNKEESINLYELFFKYLAYWPWFVAGILLMGVATWVWLRYQAPVYNVTASVLIQEQDQRSGGTPSSSPLAAMQDLGMFSVSNNFDNEVEILRSRTLLKKVVTTLGLYSAVSQERIFGYDIPLYKKSPVSVFMTPEEAEKLYAPVELSLRYTTDGKLSVKAVYTVDEESDEETLKQDFDKLPAVMNTPVGILTFMRNDTIAVGCYRAIQEAGLTVGKDISVVGFNDISIAKYMSPPLTTLHIYMDFMGAEAVSLLEERLHRGREVCKRVYIPAKLTLRDSVARLK